MFNVKHVQGPLCCSHKVKIHVTYTCFWFSCANHSLPWIFKGKREYTCAFFHSASLWATLGPISACTAVIYCGMGTLQMALLSQVARMSWIPYSLCSSVVVSVFFIQTYNIACYLRVLCPSCIRLWICFLDGLSVIHRLIFFVFLSCHCLLCSVLTKCRSFWEVPLSMQWI